MGLRQPAPPPLLLSSQSSDASKLQRSDQDREKLLRLLRPATDQLPASELLTDSQIARKRANVTTTTAAARHVVDEKRDKLQSLLLGKGKTSNNHADIIHHPDQSAAVAVSSTSTCRTVKLISPSDLKAFGYR
jgi:ribosomal protein L2